MSPNPINTIQNKMIITNLTTLDIAEINFKKCDVNN